MTQEETLLNGLIRGDDSAYITLYAHYYTPLVLFTTRYTQDKDIAKDLVQDLLVSMLGQRKSFQTVAALKVYLYRSAHNRAINHLRGLKVRNDYAYKMIDEATNEKLLLDRIIEEDVFAQLIIAIEALAPQCRRVMLLTLEGHKISEIATIMDLSVDTAKEYKKTGQKRLYQHFNSKLFSTIVVSLLG